MPATQAATKASTPADPLAEAEANRETASAEVERLATAITELRQKGRGSDPILLASLEDEREKAFKILRAADLEAAEQTAAAGAPISARVLDKIRRQRQTAEDRHAIRPTPCTR